MSLILRNISYTGIVNQYQRRPKEQATHTQTQDLLSLGCRVDVPSFGLTNIETEVPLSTTDDKTCQSSANATEHLKGKQLCRHSNTFYSLSLSEYFNNKI